MTTELRGASMSGVAERRLVQDAWQRIAGHVRRDGAIFSASGCLAARFEACVGSRTPWVVSQRLTHGIIAKKSRSRGREHDAAVVLFAKARTRQGA